jgi:hypothetical protein
MTKKYEFPDEETLARYLAMLRKVIVCARYRAYARDPQLAELLDAVENVPELLARYSEMDTAMVEGQLADYERKYLEGQPRYSAVLRDGPGPSWPHWRRA